MMTRSGSTMRSSSAAFSYSGFASMTGSSEVSTSVTAWMNSGSLAVLGLHLLDDAFDITHLRGTSFRGKCAQPLYYKEGDGREIVI